MDEWIKLLFSLTLSGSMMFAAALTVRFVFGRFVPRWFLCCLWLPVLLCFLFPLGSRYSLFIEREVERETAAPVATPSESYIPQIKGDTVPITVFYEPELISYTSPKAYNPYSILSPLWLCGVMFALAWKVIGYHYFRRRMLANARIPEEWEERLLCRLAGGRKVPRLLHSPEAKGPVLMGLWRCILFLPDTVYPPEMLEDVLAHELSHKKRHDLALKWLAAVVFCIHWFNPVCWLLTKQIARDCELACDEQVLKGQDLERCRRYGQTLVLVAAGQVPVQSLTAPMYTQKERLKERLELIMNDKKTGRHITVFLCIATLLMGLSTMWLGVYAGNVDAEAPATDPMPMGAETGEFPADPILAEGETEDPAVNPMPAEGEAQDPAVNPMPAEGEVQEPTADPILDGTEAAEQPSAEETPDVSAEQSPLLLPLETGSVAVSANFGSRVYPGTGVTVTHSGTDFRADSGTNILAAADGVVITSEYNGARGVYMIIDHGDGRTTLYAHMLWDSCTVSEGDAVTAGQVIGQVGSTGMSTGPHLHFELWQDGIAVDPLDSLSLVW